MSISSRITQIENHLKDDYTELEKLGVSVEDRNIENIKDMANQIYAKFPKTDYAEGSNITLSNTLKGKLDFDNDIVGYGQTSQEGTPTPETPIEIEVVRGTQTVYIKDENNNVITTTEIDLGEYEFAGIGNYVDTIEYDVDNDKVYKNKAIEKTLLSTLDWENATVGTNTYGTRILMNSIGKVATDINIICSHAVGIIFNDRNWFTNTTIYAETNGYVNFRNTSFTSLEEFTTFLSNNNVYAYYVLAEAVKEEITGTLADQIKALYNSQSFTGTTIIKIDGQLPLIIKVKALKGN